MAAVASITIVVDEKGAVTALNNVKNEVQSIAPAFQQVGNASRSAMGGVVGDYTRGREAAMLFREETGVNIPRAMQRVAAQSAILGPILQSAFGIFVAVGAVEILVRMAEKIGAAAVATKVWLDQEDALQAKLVSVDRVLATTTDAQIERLRKLNDAYQLIGLQSPEKNAVQAQQANDEYVRQFDKWDRLRLRVEKLQQRAQEMVTVGLSPDQPSGAGVDYQRPTDAAKQASDALAVYNKEGTLVRGVSLEFKKQQELVDTLALGYRNAGKEMDVAFGSERQKQLEETGRYLLEYQKAAAEIAKKSFIEFQGMPGGMPGNVVGSVGAFAALRKPLDEEMMANIEADNKIADQIAKNSAAGRKAVFTELDQELMVGLETDKKVADENVQAAKRAAQAWTSARDTMASGFVRLFNDLSSSGGIGRMFLDVFKHLVGEMLATWVMGMQGIEAATSVSLLGGGLGGGLGGAAGSRGGRGGGGLNSILNLLTGGSMGGGGSFSSAGASGLGGSIFGGGSSVGSLSSSAFTGTSFANSFTGPEAAMLGLPLSAGGGAITGASLPAGASVGAGTGILASLGKGLSGLLPFGALLGGNALFGNRNPALSGLGGALMGGGAGMIAGPILAGLADSLFLSGALGAGLATTLGTVGAFLGPIGAGIGLVIGLISSLFGGGKLKNQQARLEEAETRDINLVKSGYDVHQISYASAIAQLEADRLTYTQQQEQLQAGGGNYGRVGKKVDDMESWITQIEAERYKRSQQLPGMPGFGPAQFRLGGYVDGGRLHFAMGGEVPAMLHAGEFVMRPEAVGRIGRGNLDAMNRGGSGGSVHIHINGPLISAIDMKSFSSFILGGGENAIFEALARAVSEGRF